MQENLIMTIKINSYILRDKTKNKMIELTSRTIKIKTEYGFKLCLDKRDKNIRHGIPCKGKECYLDTTKSECKENEKYIGTFRAHHQYTSIPSVRDLSDGYLSLMNCIGNFEGIKCFKRKKEDFDVSEYNEIRLADDKENFFRSKRDRFDAHEITYTEFKEELEKYEKEINRLVNSYFRVINITK